MAADRRRVRKSIKQLQRVRTWQLAVLLLLMMFIAATLLRMNNVGMLQRRDAVIAADKNGVESETTARLHELQRYVVTHMNASTSKFDLKEQYNRDVKALMDDLAARSGQETANQRADAICRPQFSGYSYAYTVCMRDEMLRTAPGELAEPELPDPRLYRKEFISPLWTPDFAGFAVLVCIVLIVAIIVRALSVLVLRLMLKKRYRGI